MNTRVSHIAWRQARIGGFTASLSPFLEASTDKEGDDGADDDDGDEDEDANSPPTYKTTLIIPKLLPIFVTNDKG